MRSMESSAISLWPRILLVAIHAFIYHSIVSFFRTHKKVFVINTFRPPYYYLYFHNGKRTHKMTTTASFAGVVRPR